jgi:hypothetical protein
VTLADSSGLWFGDDFGSDGWEFESLRARREWHCEGPFRFGKDLLHYPRRPGNDLVRRKREVILNLVTLRFHYELTGAGWSSATLSDDHSEAHLSASYLSDALGNLIAAVALVVEGVSSTSCSWDEEPGEYRWNFVRREDHMEITILWFNELWGQRPDSEGSPVFAGIYPVSTVARAFLSGADSVLSSMSMTEYREKWIEHDYPTQAVERLRSAWRSSSIHVLTWQQHVRLRPEMYFGCQPSSHEIAVLIAVDAAYELVKPGVILLIEVRRDGSVRVEDNGIGISSQDHLAKPRLSMLLSLPVPAPVERGTVGPVTAFCSEFYIRSANEDFVQTAQLRHGAVVNLQQFRNEGQPTGTLVIFRPDSHYCAPGSIDVDDLRAAVVIEAEKRWRIDASDRIVVSTSD